MAGYIGKDVVHRGHGLLLDAEAAWESLPYATQKNIKKGRRAGFEVKRVAGSEEDLALLRTAWYLPDDPNFPTRIGPDDICYLAWLDGAFAGGVVMLRVGDHYFLNNLTANEVGKPHQLQSFLLWHCVEELSGTGATYIDVGVSYRPNLYRFFEQWGTIHYPVIFNPPEIRPTISFHPFEHLGAPVPVTDPEQGQQALRDLWAGAPFTFFPAREWAESALKALDLTWEEGTLTFGSPASGTVLYDLPGFFPLPFGTLVRGVEVSDRDLWDRFGCLDFVKRAYVFARLEGFIEGLDRITEGRRTAHSRFEGFFERDEAAIHSHGEEVPSAFRMSTEWNDRYAARLKDFGVPHLYDSATDRITLPCHHLMTAEQIDYVYAIFRGVLNLCSEWEPTGVKGTLKER